MVEVELEVYSKCLLNHGNIYDNNKLEKFDDNDVKVVCCHPGCPGCIWEVDTR